MIKYLLAQVKSDPVTQAVVKQMKAASAALEEGRPMRDDFTKIVLSADAKFKKPAAERRRLIAEAEKIYAVVNEKVTHAETMLAKPAPQEMAEAWTEFISLPKCVEKITNLNASAQGARKEVSSMASELALLIEDVEKQELSDRLRAEEAEAAVKAEAMADLLLQELAQEKVKEEEKRSKKAAKRQQKRAKNKVSIWSPRPSWVGLGKAFELGEA